MAQPTIILTTLIDLYKSNQNAFAQLPEFGFIVPLAEKIRKKGCACGLSGEIAQVTQAFNVVVQNLSDESVARIKTVLGRDPLVFGIQSPTAFDIKTY